MASRLLIIIIPVPCKRTIIIHKEIEIFTYIAGGILGIIKKSLLKTAKESSADHGIKALQWM